jgi:hypothetical protein
MRLTKAADVKLEPPVWMWADRIAEKQMHYVAGRADVGKGLLASTIAAHVSTGREPGSNKVVRKPRNVLYAAKEDDYGSMTAPRLRAAGADMNRVLLTRYNLVTQMGELAKVVHDKDIGLIVIDPLAAFLGHGVSRYNDSIRKVTEPLFELLEKTHSAALVIDHVTKGIKQGQDPQSAVAGSSSGFGSACRMGFLYGVDPDDPDRRLMACVKHNITDDRLAVSFEIDTVEVEHDGVEMEVPKLLFQADNEFIEAIRLVAGKKAGDAKPGRPADKSSEACEWLTNYLFHSYSKTEGYPEYPPKGTQVMADAQLKGMAERTLRRAADQMKIVKSGRGGHNVTWKLPDEILEMLTGVPDTPPEVADKPIEDASLKAMLDSGEAGYGTGPEDWTRNEDLPSEVPDDMDDELSAMLKAAEGGDDDGKA